MICRECLRPIPDDKLACPACIARKSLVDALTLQKYYLPQVRRADGRLALTKPGEEMGWHVALLSYSETAWCGRELSPHWKKRAVPFSELRAATLCDRCHAAIDLLLAELAAEVA